MYLSENASQEFHEVANFETRRGTEVDDGGVRV
jgi:hypothetical protein